MKTMQGTNERKLFNVEEFCYYINVGETKGRELLKSPESTFSVKIGNRWYAHKDNLDKWLLAKTKEH